MIKVSLRIYDLISKGIRKMSLVKLYVATIINYYFVNQKVVVRSFAHSVHEKQSTDVVDCYTD